MILSHEMRRVLANRRNEKRMSASRYQPGDFVVPTAETNFYYVDKTLRLALCVFLAFASVYNTALCDALSGQDELSTKEEKLEEIIVVASKNELGLEGSSKLDSVFGFEKDLLLNQLILTHPSFQTNLTSLILMIWSVLYRVVLLPPFLALEVLSISEEARQRITLGELNDLTMKVIFRRLQERAIEQILSAVRCLSYQVPARQEEL